MENNPAPEDRAGLEAEGVREFDLGDILSVTSGGTILSKRGIDGISDILRYMTGDKLHNHQLARAVDECAPALREQLPALAEVEIPEFNHDHEAFSSWLGKVALELGEKHPVFPLHPEDHTAIDPIGEWRMMAPDHEITVAAEPPE